MSNLRFTLNDKARNHSISQLRPQPHSPRPRFPTQCDGATIGVMIDLAGETIGVRSDALINDPFEPRLFVYHRDGSALELLRNDDAQRWCERLSRNSPSQPNQQRIGDSHGRRSGEGAASAVDVRERECLSDPLSQGTRQVMCVPNNGHAAAVEVHVPRRSGWFQQGLL